MSLGSLLQFEGFNLKKIGKAIKKNPERLLLGAVDPASSSLWSRVLGKDYAPMVDQMGGATGDTFSEAEAAGIDTSAGRGMHNIAHVVAGAIAGNYGLNQLGGAGAVPSEASSGGLSSADKAAMFGNEGYGQGMTGAETKAFDANLNGFSASDLRRLQALQSLAPKGGQQQARVKEDDYEAPDIGRYMQGATVPSSRQLKSTKSLGLADALDRGLAGEDPIDANGVEVVAIKALDKRIADLTRRAEAVARRKGVQP